MTLTGQTDFLGICIERPNIGLYLKIRTSRRNKLLKKTKIREYEANDVAVGYGEYGEVKQRVDEAGGLLQTSQETDKRNKEKKIVWE